MDQIKAKLHYQPQVDEMALFIKIETYDGKRIYLEDFVFNEKQIGEVASPFIDPSMVPSSYPKLTAIAFCQAIMDEAWEFGLRPKGYKEPANIAAKDNHISDLQKVLNKFLDKA